MRAEMIVINYYEQYLFEPDIKWPKCLFRERSYSRWAANKLISAIVDLDGCSPIIIINEFIDEMNNLSCITSNPERKWMFITAVNAAKDILLLFK